MQYMPPPYAPPPPPPLRPLTEERKKFNRVGLAFFAFMVLSMVAALGIQVIYIIGYSFATGNPADNAPVPGWFNWVVTIVSFYVIAAPICYLILRSTPAVKPERRKLSPRTFFFFLAIACFLMMTGSLIGSFINIGISVVAGEQESGVTDMLMNSDFWISLLYTGILAPILEELFFRKLLIDRLQGVGDGAVILFSGLFFGLFHGNIEQFCYAALIGALFAYIYLNTGNIFYCMGLHAILNFLGGLIPTALYMLTNSLLIDVVSTEVLELILTGVSLLASAPMYILATVGLVLFVLNFKKLKKQIRPGKAPMGQVCRAAFGTAGVILFLVMAGIEVVLTIFS